MVGKVVLRLPHLSHLRLVICAEIDYEWEGVHKRSSYDRLAFACHDFPFYYDVKQLAMKCPNLQNLFISIRRRCTIHAFEDMEQTPPFVHDEDYTSRAWTVGGMTNTEAEPAVELYQLESDIVEEMIDSEQLRIPADMVNTLPFLSVSPINAETSVFEARAAASRVFPGIHMINADTDIHISATSSDGNTVAASILLHDAYIGSCNKCNQPLFTSFARWCGRILCPNWTTLWT